MKKNEYWIDNGSWGCTIIINDNNIKIKTCDAEDLINKILIPATKDEYLNSTLNYATDDGISGLDYIEFIKLKEIINSISDDKILLIINAYNQGILQVNN